VSTNSTVIGAGRICQGCGLRLSECFLSLKSNTTMITLSSLKMPTVRAIAILAESDFFEPLTINSLVTPGFDGRVCFPTHKGFITMQVKPAARP
jgi:hypothetical protein